MNKKLFTLGMVTVLSVGLAALIVRIKLQASKTTDKKLRKRKKMKKEKSHI